MELQQLANDALAIHYALQRAMKLGGDDLVDALDTISDQSETLFQDVEDALGEAEDCTADEEN